MTNWMTVAGLALIVGGLATLIGFRSVLFGSGRRDDHERAALSRKAAFGEGTAVAGPPETTETPAPTPAFNLAPAEAEPTEVVLSWPPINDDRPVRIRRLQLWSTRDVNSRPGAVGHHRAVFTGRPGDRATVLESRPQPCPRTRYVSRHAADPSS